MIPVLLFTVIGALTGYFVYENTLIDIISKKSINHHFASNLFCKWFGFSGRHEKAKNG